MAHQSVVVGVAVVVDVYQAAEALLCFSMAIFRSVQMVFPHMDPDLEVDRQPASPESRRPIVPAWNRRSSRERRWDQWLLCLEGMEACLIWPVLLATLDQHLWSSTSEELILGSVSWFARS